MAYNATYESADMDDIILDFLGTYGVQLVALGGIIALVWIYKLIKR